MKREKIVVLLFCSLPLALMVASYLPSGEYRFNEKRRQRLLEMYPPGRATRADVHRKWERTRWEVSEPRPVSGWTALTNAWIRTRALNSEQRTGKTVHLVESQLAPDGLFSLCVCWFYYDDKDRIVDVEWQWHTD